MAVLLTSQLFAVKQTLNLYSTRCARSRSLSPTMTSGKRQRPPQYFITDHTSPLFKSSTRGTILVDRRDALVGIDAT